MLNYGRNVGTAWWRVVSMMVKIGDVMIFEYSEQGYDGDYHGLPPTDFELLTLRFLTKVQ
jgi:hypothetical protein